MADFSDFSLRATFEIVVLTSFLRNASRDLRYQYRHGSSGFDVIESWLKCTIIVVYSQVAYSTFNMLFHLALSGASGSLCFTYLTPLNFIIQGIKHLNLSTTLIKHQPPNLLNTTTLEVPKCKTLKRSLQLLRPVALNHRPRSSVLIRPPNPPREKPPCYP